MKTGQSSLSESGPSSSIPPKMLLRVRGVMWDSPGGLSTVTLSDQVAFVADPNAIQHVEAIWFQGQGPRYSFPRAIRIGGFDLQQPRLSLTALAATDDGRVQEYLARRTPVRARHGVATEVVLESIATMYGTFAPDLLCLSSWPDPSSLELFGSDPDLPNAGVGCGVLDT